MASEEEVTCKAEEPSTILQQNLKPIYNPEELIAKSIAPVKVEHLLPPSTTRLRSSDDKVGVDDDSKERKGSTVLAKEKKSKRQAKRDRHQEQKSASNICPEVAKYGKSDACRFGTACRFNHDLDAYVAEKPADLDGCCPFLQNEKSCPYGITCRFFNTHKETEVSESHTTSERCIETNHLKKDVQRLLWKNKASFPKADALLKLLGLRVGHNTKSEADIQLDDSHVGDINGSNAVSVHGDNDTSGTDNNNDSCGNNNEASGVGNAECASAACSEKDCAEGAFIPTDSRPTKKTKCPIDKPSCPIETSNGKHVLESNMDGTSADGSMQGKNIDDNFGSCKSDTILRPHRREIKLIDFSGKLYLAPLTTVGNLPFRRICKSLGADITCGEMAMSTNLLQGQASEWALLRRHSSEDIFGVQVCGSYPDTLARTVELIDRECEVDFVDINMGCPIDLVCNKGAGSSLLTKPMRMKSIIQAASRTIDKPITVKVRTGYIEGRNRIDSLISDISQCGASAITIHGRSRQQRYSKLADWDYIYQCARKAPKELSVIGNGDIFSYTDWNKHLSECPELSSSMIGRGALIKPWIFTEIKEQRHWDITSGERLEILKDYVNYGITHWGSDTKGVETTRHFLLEWLSYTYRYIPVGLLDVVPQRINWRSPGYFGRNDLETLMASDSAADWIRISEMLLGKVPEGFNFAPKHKSNAYDRAENG